MAGPAKRAAKKAELPVAGLAAADQGCAETVGCREARARVDGMARRDRAKRRAGKALKPLLAAKPRTAKLADLIAAIAEASPYLWDLIRADPDRFLALLEADPEAHFAHADRGGRRAPARPRDDDAEVMRALAARQGGGRAADRARRHRRRLAGRARHARAHRLRRCGARRGGALPAARRRRAGKARAASTRPGPEQGCGYVVLAMGKMGAHELNYSSDIDLIVLYDERAVAEGIEPGALFVRLTRSLVKLMQERTADGYVFRTDLRLRPDPASTPDRDLDALGAELLREHRAELGARRDDQGAPLRRRPRGRARRS